MKMEKNSNPEGKCFYCGRSIHYKDYYCGFCGKPNEGWTETDQSRCGNCHEKLQEGDKYCRICGTKVGEGAYEPYQDIMECIYGPEPALREHICDNCGYRWLTCYMVDDENYCPQCGCPAPAGAPSEQAKREYEEQMKERMKFLIS